MGEVMMYTLSPLKITGMTLRLDDEEEAFLLDDYLKKPFLGGWYGKNTTANPEVIIQAHPDYFTVDIRQETRRFYALFYHKNLTETELDKVLYNAVRKPAK